MQEYIIGRSIGSNLEVPPSKVEVNGKHAKITVSDSGEWRIEDLDSNTGVFIRDDNCDFQRIYNKTISEDTVIRLGQESYGSYTFMAHRVLNKKPDYSYEFAVLRRLLDDQAEREAEYEKKAHRNMNLLKLSAPLMLAVTVIVQYAIPGLKNNYELNMWISRGAMGLAPALAGLFLATNPMAFKNLRARRIKLLRCPCCNNPISEFDVDNMQCSRCKAK